jgi:hypothetical protein
MNPLKPNPITPYFMLVGNGQPGRLLVFQKEFPLNVRQTGVTTRFLNDEFYVILKDE